MQIRFINPLLDAVVDRFGTKDVQYSRVDDHHFCVSAKVEISDQFFAWVCGFGKRAKIINPSSVVEDMKKFLHNLTKMYEKE